MAVWKLLLWALVSGASNEGYYGSSLEGITPHLSSIVGGLLNNTFLPASSHQPHTMNGSSSIFTDNAPLQDSATGGALQGYAAESHSGGLISDQLPAISQHQPSTNGGHYSHSQLPGTSQQQPSTNGYFGSSWEDIPSDILSQMSSIVDAVYPTPLVQQQGLPQQQPWMNGGHDSHNQLPATSQPQPWMNGGYSTHAGQPQVPHHLTSLYSYQPTHPHVQQQDQQLQYQQQQQQYQQQQSQGYPQPAYPVTHQDYQQPHNPAPYSSGFLGASYLPLAHVQQQDQQLQYQQQQQQYQQQQQSQGYPQPGPTQAEVLARLAQVPARARKLPDRATEESELANGTFIPLPNQDINALGTETNPEAHKYIEVGNIVYDDGETYVRKMGFKKGKKKTFYRCKGAYCETVRPTRQAIDVHIRDEHLINPYKCRYPECTTREKKDENTYAHKTAVHNHEKAVHGGILQS